MRKSALCIAIPLLLATQPALWSQTKLVNLDPAEVIRGNVVTLTGTGFSS
jgi:hypothetical protein